MAAEAAAEPALRFAMDHERAEAAAEPAPRFAMVHEQAPAKVEFNFVIGEAGGVLARDLDDDEVQAPGHDDAFGDVDDNTYIDMSKGVCPKVIKLKFQGPLFLS